MSGIVTANKTANDADVPGDENLVRLGVCVSTRNELRSCPDARGTRKMICI